MFVFNAVFYTTSDDIKTVNKTITQVTTATLKPLHTVDMLNPVFIIDSDNISFSINYVYIQEFDRYYFCTLSPTTAKKIIVSCSVDVLYTYRTGLKSVTACVTRSESIGKPTDVVDSSLPINPNNKSIVLIDLGSSIFTSSPSYPYFLTVQGT